MAEDLRHRYAEALAAAFGPSGECRSSNPLHCECGPHAGASARFDRLADAAMAVRDEELERLKVVETASIGAHALLDDAEEALARVRAEHRVHRCEEDGHVLERTPNPCVNDGVCSCGQPGDRCPTRIALNDLVAERLASAVPKEDA